MKKFLNFVWLFLKKHCVQINTVLFAIALGIQFFSAVPLISGFMDHRSIVEAHDNDAGKMVEVALRSRWYNDNNFRYYGPIYFRIANTFHSMVPASSGRYEIASNEAMEESVHFYVLLTSLLGLFLLGFSCSFLISERWEIRSLLTLFLMASFLHHPVWAQYLFTAHPDQLLTGLVALSTLLTIRSFQKNLEDKSLGFAGFSWGLTICTKLSSLFFLPGWIALLFYFQRERVQFKAALKKLVVFAAAGYFLMGLPQNIDIWGSLKKMLNLSDFSSAPTWVSFADWWANVGGQTMWPAVVVVFGIIFFGSKIREFNFRQQVVLFLLMNLGLFILTLRSLELNHAYYVMPFVGTLVIALIILLNKLSLYKFIFSSRAPIVLQSVLFSIFFLGSHFNLFQFTTAAATQKSMLNCRPYFQKVYGLSKKALAENKSIISTPYTPVPLENDLVRVDWELNFETVTKVQPNLMVFNRSYYARYTDSLTVSKYVQLTNSDWGTTQKFYMTFLNQADVNAGSAGQWHKIYSDECSLEVWERQ